MRLLASESEAMAPRDKDQLSALVGVQINVPFLARLGALRLGPSKRKYLRMNRPSRERSGWSQARAVYLHVGGGIGLDLNDMVSRCTLRTFEQRLRAQDSSSEGIVPR